MLGSGNKALLVFWPLGVALDQSPTGNRLFQGTDVGADQRRAQGLGFDGGDAGGFGEVPDARIEHQLGLGYLLVELGLVQFAQKVHPVSLSHRFIRPVYDLTDLRIGLIHGVVAGDIQLQLRPLGPHASKDL